MLFSLLFFFSSRRRHTRCALVTGVQTCALPILLPDDWIASATTKQAGIDVPGRGYGYQWWTNDDGSFAAQGIFGQGIFIDPKRKQIGRASWRERVCQYV